MKGSKPRVVIFCMPEYGHFKRLLPVIAGLAVSGVEVNVFTDARFAAAIVSNGGRWHDLFRDRALDSADNRSRPIPCRYVSFAGKFAASVIREAEALKPDLVIHDAFAVIAVPVANRLGLPRVNICAGHNLAPGPTVAALCVDARVQIADECSRAVEILRTQFGIPDASPFSYITSLSPDLNLICEPPQFLTVTEREAFKPCAFFGSLPEPTPVTASSGSTQCQFPSGDSSRSLRLYCSLGTVVWRYYADYAWAVLEALALAAQQCGDLQVVIGLGGQPIDSRCRHLRGESVRVESYVDQWQLLQASDVFLTHHGLNSTHEAIYHGVPMLSSPFFSDQPGLARRCQAFGLAVPIVHGLRAPLTATDILNALDLVASRRGAMTARLDLARQWELEVMAARPAVIARIIALA